MERLQKVLAHSGVASRRKCEELIESGRVQVDGVIVTELGFKVNPGTQRIAVDGQPITLERKVCLMINKPTSRITSVSDPEGRKTVMELLKDVPERVYPVGRLDYDTSGLLIMTNDGDLTHRLLHPSYKLEKIYRATVLGLVDKQAIKHLESGIELDDGKTAPAKVKVLRQHPRESVVDLAIHEGRNRQVRRMFDVLDMPVKRLKRIQFGPLTLSELGVGEWRYLTKEEWNILYTSVGLDAPVYELRDQNQVSYDKKTARPQKAKMQKKHKSFRRSR